jgi:predicted nucleic acid-binding protein
MDETHGRRAAERRHISYTGTLGVLAEGAKRQLLDFGMAVGRLRQTNFYVSDELLDRLTGQK